MHRDKQYLIEKGFPDERREDFYWIVGEIYDELMEYGHIDEIIVDKIIERRKYLDKHREIIGNKNWALVTPKNIIDTIMHVHGDKLVNWIVFKNNGKEIKEIKPLDINELDENKIIDKTGVYGIYIDNEIVYIGITETSFKQRFQEHRRKMLDCTNNHLLYRGLRQAKLQNKDIQLKPIIITSNNFSNKVKFTNTELKCMEFALITYLQPKYNIDGVKHSYHFRWGKEGEV